MTVYLVEWGGGGGGHHGSLFDSFQVLLEFHLFTIAVYFQYSCNSIFT